MNRPDLRGQCGGLLVRTEERCALKTMHCHIGESRVTCFSQFFFLLIIFCKHLLACQQKVVIRREALQFSKILLGSI